MHSDSHKQSLKGMPVGFLLNDSRSSQVDNQCYHITQYSSMIDNQQHVTRPQVIQCLLKFEGYSNQNQTNACQQLCGLLTNIQNVLNSACIDRIVSKLFR